MFDNILSPTQLELVPFLTNFKREYYLVGGTAIALQIGHRQSIDFDLFKKSKVNHQKIDLNFRKADIPFQLLFSDAESFHILANGVKITFFQYPFDVPTSVNFQGIKMPNLLNLAAMKAYALGRRAKWKDYVDLHFILKDHFSLDEVSAKTKEIFGELFSPKLFRQQLCYFEDIDYTEEVVYVNRPIDETVIKNFLTELVTRSI